MQLLTMIIKHGIYENDRQFVLIKIKSIDEIMIHKSVDCEYKKECIEVCNPGIYIIPPSWLQQI